MIDSIFRETAAEAGWNDAAQIDVLLRYAAQAGSTATLHLFLDRERRAADDTVALSGMCAAMLPAKRKPAVIERG